VSVLCPRRTRRIARQCAERRPGACDLRQPSRGPTGIRTLDLLAAG